MKLKKALYGLHQIPRAFWQYVTKKLEQSGLNQSKFDPCIFVGDKLTFIVYVDDIIFWARNEDIIHYLSIYLRVLVVALEQEDCAAVLFGVALGQ